MATVKSEYMSVSDAARFLSFSRRTIERKIAEGKIAVIHIGRTIRIPMSEIERLVNADAMPKER